MEKEKDKRFPVRLAILGAAVLVVSLVASLVDFQPDLSHLDASLLSGGEEGNYYAIANRLSARAKSENGRLKPIATSGSVDNIKRLLASKEGCKHHFALVQDGIKPKEEGLELVARLRKSESVFIVGKGGDSIESFSQLRGMRVGVGAAESGTDHLARRVFGDPDLKSLGVTLSNHTSDEQIAKLKSGELDLGVFVLDEDAELIRRIVRDEGLQLAALKHLDVIARKFPFMWHGRIGAGQFDPIAMLPPSDRRVFRVDTLILGNDCASRSEEIALLTLLSHEFPDLIEHNRKKGTSRDFPTDDLSVRFFEEGGAGILDRHAPWVTSLMPVANWMYVIMGLSLLMNGMTFWHKFRLWRIDANQDKANELVREVFGQHLTPQEIHDLEPEVEHASEKSLALLDRAVTALSKLRMRCQKQANSMLVPMGQEGSYRFQEDQMETALHALRHFRQRATDMHGAPEPPPPPETDEDEEV